MIEARNSDDLEDTQSICDDTDVEVASEVQVSGQRAILHPLCLQMVTFQEFAVKNAIFPHLYLPFLGD